MEEDKALAAEYFATRSDLTIEEFCARLEQEFGLFHFVFEPEEDHDRGRGEANGISFVVSRSRGAGLVRKKQWRVAEECNFGIVVAVARDCAAAGRMPLGRLLSDIAQRLANRIGTPLFHSHSGRLPGKLTESIFLPVKKQ